MNKSEDFVYSVLKKYSKNNAVWKFFELQDEKGESEPQAKFYPNLGYWVAYPDFECYDDNKLMLLVEVKGHYDYFDGETGKLGMKHRNYISYQKVRMAEKIPVKICFVVEYRWKRFMFWETIDNIMDFPFLIKDRIYKERNYKTKQMEL